MIFGYVLGFLHGLRRGKLAGAKSMLLGMIQSYSAGMAGRV